MDGVSGASAVASLVILGGKLSVQAHTFVGKIKDAPQRVTDIHSDLKTAVYALGKIEAALRGPEGNGVFGLQHARDEFESVVQTLMEVFNELSRLMQKYDKVDSSVYQKMKWATIGLDEATELGKVLAIHKAYLLTIQLTQSEALSSINNGVVNIEEYLNIIRNGVQGRSHHSKSYRRIEQWLDSATTYAETVIAPEEGPTSNEFNGGATTDVKKEVERFIWVELPPALFRCINCLRSITPSLNKAEYETLLNEGLSSRPIRTSSFKRLTFLKELRDAFQNESYPRLLDSDYLHDREAKASDLLRAVLTYFKERGPLIPKKVADQKLVPKDLGYQNPVEIYEPTLYQAVCEGHMAIRDYQALRFLLWFFSTETQAQNRSEGSRSYLLGRLGQLTTSRAWAKAFHDLLGVPDTNFITSVNTLQSLILKYDEAFDPLIQRPNTNANSFLFIERTIEVSKKGDTTAPKRARRKMECILM